MSSKKVIENVAKQPSNARDEVSPSPQSATKPRRKRRPPAQPWKKPPGFPKRYLSAYNLFFKQERERLLKVGLCSDSSQAEGGLEGGKEEIPLMRPTLPDPNAPKSNAARKHARSSGIGFANLARIVAKKWKNLPADLKAPFEEVAMKDKERYQREMVVWRAEQEKKKEAEAAEGEVKEGTAQWGSSGQPYSGPYASPMSEVAPSQTHQGASWPPHTPATKFSPNDGRPTAFVAAGGETKSESTVHGFRSAAIPAPRQDDAGVPFTPDRKTSPRKPLAEEISPASISPRRSSEPAYRRANTFESAGEQRAVSEGYHPSAHYEGYEGYVHHPHMTPYAIHYAPAGTERPGIPYYRMQEGFPAHVRPRSLPATARPSPYSVPFHRYEMPYQVHIPEYSYAPAYYTYPSTPHAQAKYSPPPLHPPPPPPQGKPPVVTPHTYGFHPPTPRRFQQEETLQLHASREDFKVPRTLEPARQAEGGPKKKQKETSTKESQPSKAAKNEESSLLESSLEHIDTNLDTDTVDFLTTLELE